jgi:hypothetical protein
VLDHVERRRLPVEPAREDAAELAVRTAHLELDEGAGQLLDLPGCGRLAGPQADNHIADPDGLAGPQRQVAPQAVTLVEEANHRDPLRHRGRPGRELGHRLRNIDRLVLDLRLALPVRLVRPARRAGGERQHHRQARGGNEATHHDQSGVQAW